MLRGMTGYGKASTGTQAGELTVELSSLNRRHLELRTSLPSSLSFLEAELRQLLHKKLHRGAVTLTAQLISATPSRPMEPSLEVLSQIKTAAEKISAVLEVSRYDAIQVVLRTAAGLWTLFPHQTNDKELLQSAMLEATESAVTALLRMKQAEGESIAADIQGRLSLLRKLRSEIEPRAANATSLYRQTLEKRLRALGLKTEDDDRILREIVIYADRSDVSEELKRWQHHEEQMLQAVTRSELVTGREMEFRLQELSREINTLGAKTDDVEVSERIVLAKGELEKIREQLQNVE